MADTSFTNLNRADQFRSAMTSKSMIAAKKSISLPQENLSDVVGEPGNLSVDLNNRPGSAGSRVSAKSSSGSEVSDNNDFRERANSAGSKSSDCLSENEMRDFPVLRKQVRVYSSLPNNTPDVAENELLRRRSASVLEVTEHAHTRLREELLNAQKELKLKDEECKELSKVQEKMGEELEDLTASLFEEANKMVQDAHVKRIQAEKHLKESNEKIDILQAEVTALKELVITSTPSAPNRHLHPQLEAIQKKKNSTTGPVSYIRGHKRSTSHHNFTQDAQSIESEFKVDLPPMLDEATEKEVDPVHFAEFNSWRQKPSLTKTSAFLSRIVTEDVLPCLSFQNKQFSSSVFECVMQNTLIIEPVPEKQPFPRKCALTDINRVCKYRIKTDDSGSSHFVSQFARNRVAAVCDFFTYIRYIVQGLVKAEANDTYSEIIRLRHQMSLAKLGLS